MWDQASEAVLIASEPVQTDRPGGDSGGGGVNDIVPVNTSMTPYIRSRRDLATGVAGSVSRGYGARRQAECFNQWRFGWWNKPFSEPTRRRNVAWEQQIVFLGLQLQRERERVQVQQSAVLGLLHQE